MAAPAWVTYLERLVGRNHPSLADTVNRPLRGILSGSGYNPDADPFPGLMGPVYNVKAFGAPATGTVSDSAAFRAAVVAAAATGRGTVVIPDGQYLLTADMSADLAAYDKTPIAFIWGAARVRVKSRQIPRSHHHHFFYGTQFILEDENGTRVTGSVFPFYVNAVDTTPAGGISTTNGSAVVTLATPSDPNWAKLEVGSPLLVNGFVPPLGVDKTTINVGGGIDGSTTSITVVSTAAFPSASDQAWPQGGRLRIENEIISYTSKDATHFLGCTRGVEGTTAAAHADTTPVQRVSYQPCVVLAISGSSVTLDVTMNITATALAVQIGHLDVSFDGVADFDGNKDPAVDDSSNPLGLWLTGARKIYIGPGLTFRNFDHGGWTLQGCQDCVAYTKGSDNGYLPGALGAGFWVFGWNKRLTIDVLEVAGCGSGLQVDDRTTAAQITDGPAEDSTFRVRRATRMGSPGLSGNGINITGSRNCIVTVERAQFIAGLGGANGIFCGGVGQWGDETTNPAVNNVLETQYVDSPDGSALDINVSSAGNAANTVIMRRKLGVCTLQPNNTFSSPDAVRQLTYGATVNTDCSRSELFTINATNGTAFTIANPTQLTEGRRVEYYISNSSGGAMGAITWGSKFRLAGAFTNPANNQARMIRFRYHRSNDTLIEVARSAADQPV